MKMLTERLLLRGRGALRFAGAALALALLAPGLVWAQPANDNFANAEVIPIDPSGVLKWGDVVGNSAGATAEAGEPAHGGGAAANSIWYSWTPTAEGIVYLDAFDSAFTARVAVYSGTTLANLSVVVASDLFASYRTQTFVNGWRLGGVKFRAKAGMTYYFAVDGGQGAVRLRWAYNSAGLFRFSSAAYRVPETGNVLVGEHGGDDVQQHTVPGQIVTITRLFGSEGRVRVDWTTQNGTALAGTDYIGASGQVVFENYEMSRSFVVTPIDGRAPFDPAGPNRNRQFTVNITNVTLLGEDTTLIGPPRVDATQASAAVTILDVDVINGQGDQDPPPLPIVNLEATAVRCSEGAGTATIFVRRDRLGLTNMATKIQYSISSQPPSGRNNQRNNTFPLQAGSDYATPDPATMGVQSDAPDYYDPNVTNSPANAYTGELSWGTDDYDPKPINILISDDLRPEFNEDIYVQIWKTPGSGQNEAIVGQVSSATITILFDDFPAGAIDHTFNPDFQLFTDPPNNPSPGANGVVYGMAVQFDDRPIIVGNFTAYNSTPRNRVARLTVDGAIDPSFVPGTGANDFINAVVLAPGEKPVIVGGFTAYNGASRRGVARLNTDGSLDTGFIVGQGADSTVWSVDVLFPDGQVVVGGGFTTFDGEPRNYVARLRPNGSLDSGFVPASVDGAVYAVAFATGGKVVIGGIFENVGGVRRRGIARLNPDGSLDNSFNPGIGLDGPVYALKVQPDGRVLVGGEFRMFDLRSRNNLVRLNADGSLDTTFDPGQGTDGPVYTFALQPDGRIFVGGLFTSYNETRRMALARLFITGELDTSILDTAYNHFAGFTTEYFTPEVNPRSYIMAVALQRSLNVLAAGSFTRVGGGRTSLAVRPGGLTLPELGTPGDYAGGYSRKVYRKRSNIARLLGGETTGPGSIGFTRDNYVVDESIGQFLVTLIRTNGSLGQIAANAAVPYTPPGPGLALSGPDFINRGIRPLYPWSWNFTAGYTRMCSFGIFGLSSYGDDQFGNGGYITSADDWYLTIPGDTLVQGNRTAPLELSLPSQADVFYLGGENIPLGAALATAGSTMTLVDDDRLRGVLGFSHAEYTVNEGAGYATIVVTRTNGSAGAVSVQYQTTATGTATANTDYTPTNGTLSFAEGVLSNAFRVRILDDSQVEQDETIGLRLLTPGGGATLGLANATLTIIDNDLTAGRLSLSATNYSAPEDSGGVTLTVTRTGGSAGAATVQLVTADGTATAGSDYTGLTNTLTWAHGDSTPRTVTLPFLPDDLVEPDETLTVRLQNYTGGVLPGLRTNATVTILNDDYPGTFAFAATNYHVKENGDTATLTILRRNGQSGTAQIAYTTVAQTAQPGSHYLAASGTLTFTNGEIAKTLTLTLLDNPDFDGNRAFRVDLGNPAPAGATLRPGYASATVRIQDDESYNENAGSGDTAFDALGGLNGPVRALALQADGRIVVGGDFTFAGDYSRYGVARFNADGSLDLNFLRYGGGVNDSVRALLVQTDQRVLLGGWFTSLGGVSRNYLARLNTDGSLDTSFNPGAGADNPVLALAEQFLDGQRKLLLGGSFTSFNFTPCARIVRLNDDGTVDPAFQPGLGADGAIHALAVYPADMLHGGKILIAGDFTRVNNHPRKGVARLLPDGSVDLTFDPGAGADATVRALLLQPDGRILVGGGFTNFNGALTRSLARLNPDGSLDAGFNVGAGANGRVLALALQPDNRILVAGEFTRANALTRNRLTRLMPDGSADTRINFGTGANDFVAAVATQTDDKIVIGGGFTEFDGVPRLRLARLYGGSLRGGGSFEFAAPAYFASESGGSATITVRRQGGTSDQVPGSPVTVGFRTLNGTAIAGLHYVGVTNTLTFPAGETFLSVSVPLLDDEQVNDDRELGLELFNPQPTIWTSLGLQPVATLTVLNDDSEVRFASAAYAQGENAVSGRANIPILRTGSLLGTVGVDFLTTTNGTATPNVDFTMVTNRITFLPGVSNMSAFVPLFDDGVREGDETVVLQLRNVSGAGARLVSPSEAVLTIVDQIRIPDPTNNNFAHAAPITGASGTIAGNTTDGTAEPGEPAHAGYAATNSIWFSWIAPYDGPVTFDTFGSEIDTLLAVYTGNDVARLSLVAANDYIYPEDVRPSKVTFNARAGTIYRVAVDGWLGEAGNVSLAWSYHSGGVFRFTADSYECSDNDTATTGHPTTARSVRGARVTVTRVAGASGRVSVDIATANSNAVAGVDFTETKATLVFDDWEMSKSVIIPILNSSPQTNNRVFTVFLSNPQRDASESAEVLAPRLDPDHRTALVTIQDFEQCSASEFGTVCFERSSYRVTEGVGTLTIRVWRRCGVSSSRIDWAVDSSRGTANTDYQDNFFGLSAGSDYATPDPSTSTPATTDPWDFRPIYDHTDGVGWGELTWGQNENTAKEIQITINDDDLAEFNEDFIVRLYATRGGVTDYSSIGNVREAVVTILYDDYPAGTVDHFFNPDNELYSQPPANTKPGANGTVYSLLVQPDNSVVIGGNFTTYNNVQRNRIARINPDGTLDTTFNPQGGVAYSIDQQMASVSVVKRDNNGRLLIGGLMTTYNGVERRGVARLNADGSLDNTFNPGLGTLGAVWDLAIQQDGRILVAGDFTTFNNQPRQRIVRLNADGSVDSTFNPGTNGPNNTIYALALTAAGGVIIGGDFSEVGGLPRGGIARLKSDGTLDSTFAPLLGANGVVRALALQADGLVLLGGDFTRVDNFALNRLARLQSNGRVDPNFQPGTGADDTVFNITLTGTRIYVGGLFTTFNGTHRHGFARLYGSGMVDTTFLDTAYNQFAGVSRPYFNADVNPKPYILTSAVQGDGAVLIGGRFDRVGGGRLALDVARNPAVQTNLWEVETLNRYAVRSRGNLARLLNPPTAGPGNLGLLTEAYAVNEGGRYTFIQLARENGSLGRLGANFTLPQRDAGVGKAQAGVDYTFASVGPVYETTHGGGALTRCYSDALWGTNNITWDVLGRLWSGWTDDDVVITVLDNSAPQENRETLLALDSPTQMDAVWLGGENIAVGGALGRPGATLTIRDDDTRPGVLGFAAAEFFVNENAGQAVITVTRTNGLEGVVSVQFVTTNQFLPAATATPGADFTVVSGTITLLDGQAATNFTIPIFNDSQVEADETINLHLFNPGGGAALGLTNAVCFILDDDFAPGHVNFSRASYATNEDAGAALVTVTRTGGNAGAVSVQIATADGTNAVSGRDYLGFTNTLVWNDRDAAPKTVVVPLLPNQLVEPDKEVRLRLFNASTNGLVGNIHSNAVVTIVNDDDYGRVQFAARTFSVKENGGAATITVVRASGSAETVAVNFSTLAGTAEPGTQYGATNGTLVFPAGVVSRTFAVPVRDNVTPGGNTYLTLQLSGASPAGTLGEPVTATLFIVDDETFNEPAGSVDTAFEVPVGAAGDVFALAVQSDNRIVAGGDFTMFNQMAAGRVVRLNPYSGTVDADFGAVLNGAVRALVSQSDDRVLTAGDFTSVNGTTRNHIARLSYDGTLDTSFNPGAGTDNPVQCLAETFLGGPRKVLIGGGFTVVNSVARNGIARLHDDGSVDTGFNPGSGANGSVLALAVYPTNTLHGGKVIIGGNFDLVGGVSRKGIARLNVDGSLDTSFNPGTGANDSVRAVAIQTDGRVLIGGYFTNVNGVARSRIARLNTDGSLDTSFNPGLGANDSVYAILVQQDQRILLGGEFTRCNGVTRGRITRLLPDGSVDPTINFGTGANSFVAALALQHEPWAEDPSQTREKIVLGGGFSEVNGIPCGRVARIYGGSQTGMGAFEFSAANYLVDETATNALITIRRVGGTSGPLPGGDTQVTFATANGTAVTGLHYRGVTNTLTFPVGETLATVLVAITNDAEINADRTVNLVLSNPQPASGPQLGGQPFATLTILNDDSAFRFSASSYSRNEQSVDGLATIAIERFGSVRQPASVDFYTTTNGTATPNVDFIAVSNRIYFAVGESNRTVTVRILDDTLAEGNETVELMLAAPLGALLVAPHQVLLTIVDNEFAPGQLYFAQPAYMATENDGVARVTILRTNGTSGVVSLNYYTTDGTALAGSDYAASSGTVTFADGEFSKTLTIPLINDAIAEPAETFTLTVTNASNGASLIGPTTVAVTIMDDEVGLSFSAPAYAVTEDAGVVTLTVLRLGDTNPPVSALFSTTNATATAGSDYMATSGRLDFASGETVTTLTIPILEDASVESDEAFFVTLSSPLNAQLVTPSSTSVVILDNDPGIAFATNAVTVLESGTNVWITVVRSNANSGTVSVNYTTSDGSATNGLDYGAVSGTIVFTNGETVKMFSVPITPDTVVEGNETFEVLLLNPTGGAQLLAPSSMTVTIQDDDSGLAFSAPTYSVSEGGISALITVIRSGDITNTVSVSYSTADGTATALGPDYLPTSGILVFTNGETVKTFSVQVVNDTLIEGDETVLLLLSNPAGQASLLPPSAATLTIVDNDGSLIVPAGAAMISETGGVNNGAVDPGERVTLWFAFRNAVGEPATNVVATLLSTNGVTSPTAAMSYGTLLPGGASVSRQFAFTANGTNGQTILATFQLRDAVTNLGLQTFAFTLGSSVVTFSNAAAITIADLQPAVPPYAASPYPSTIAVSGIGGAVANLSVTLTNVAHTSPDDIDLLLVGPAGQKMVLMSDAGGSTAITNVTLTFSDAAASYLPDSGPIVSGTNKPTNYQLGDPFPLPAPSGPYGDTLSVFNGSNPNGLWSLYAVDDTAYDSGSIVRGWRLTLTTAHTVPAACDLSVTMKALSNPVVATSNLTYVTYVTNHGPSTATGVVLTNQLASSVAFVSGTTSQGSLTTNGAGLITVNIGTLAKDAWLIITNTIATTTAGQLTNAVTVVAAENDPNFANNTAMSTTEVIAPKADLVLVMADAPDPVPAGFLLTYTMIVTNLGPATATDVVVTNWLPLGTVVVTNVPSQGSAGQVGGNAWAALGDLAAGARASITLVVRPTVVGILTSTATVTANPAVTDPFKGNNTASVKTVVDVQIAAGHTAGGITLTHAGMPGTVLQARTSLSSGNWVTIMTNPPAVLTLPLTNVSQFYRLVPPAP